MSDTGSILPQIGEVRTLEVREQQIAAKLSSKRDFVDYLVHHRYVFNTM